MYNLYYEIALTLLHRQCGGSGSPVAVGSSMLQDVVKHSRIVLRSQTPFQESARKCRVEEVF